jgi:hypothetical protein
MADSRPPRTPPRTPDQPIHTPPEVGDDGLERRRYVIGARKVAPERRDVATPVLQRPEARYRNLMHSDDDPTVPEGANVAYEAWLTDDEAAAFRTASNARYVQLDFSGTADLITVPPASTLAYMGASLTQQGTLNGANVKVAVLDGGTTTALRAQCSWTMIAKQNFTTTPEGPDEITTEHGCWVTPEAVPPGGKLLEAIIANDAGTASWADVAAGLIWAVDNGALVVNLSYSSPPGAVSGVMQDAIVYAGTHGVQLVASAGNDALNRINYPADQSRVFGHVHSSGAFDETTDTLASFSNYHVDMSGVAPGNHSTSIDKTGTAITWSGTSSSSPKMALLIAMLCTGGTYSPQQVGSALRASARLTGQTHDQEGHGAWNLANAKGYLAMTAGPVAALRQTTTQSIPNSTWTAINLDTELSDTNNGHSGTTNPSRWICPSGQAGYYSISGLAALVSGTTGGRIAAIGKNGIIQQGSLVRVAPCADGFGNGIATREVKLFLAVGDYVEVYGLQDSGAAINTDVAWPNGSGLDLAFLRA